VHWVINLVTYLTLVVIVRQDRTIQIRLTVIRDKAVLLWITRLNLPSDLIGWPGDGDRKTGQTIQEFNAYGYVTVFVPLCTKENNQNF